jgi:hypothetical protein
MQTRVLKKSDLSLQIIEQQRSNDCSAPSHEKKTEEDEEAQRRKESKHRSIFT